MDGTSHSHGYSGPSMGSASSFGEQLPNTTYQPHQPHQPGHATSVEDMRRDYRFPRENGSDGLSDGDERGRPLTRNYSRNPRGPGSESVHSFAHSDNHSNQMVQQHPWRSWKNPHSRSATAQSHQPFTINFSFGGVDSSYPGAPPRTFTISSDGGAAAAHSRKPSSPWVDEVEQAKANNQLRLWPGSGDLNANLFRQPDGPHFPYERLGTPNARAADPYARHFAGNEKASLASNEQNFSFTPFASGGPIHADNTMSYPAEKQPPPPPPPPGGGGGGGGGGRGPPTDEGKGDGDWIIEPVEAGFLRLVQHFDFKWYGSTMGTGIVAILLFTFHQTYASASSALYQLSVIFYVANVALFSCIFLMTVLRYLLYPKLFFMMVSDPGQAMYLGTFPMGFATIITMTVNVMVPKYGGAWPSVVFAFWWVDVVVSLATALVIPWLLQIVHHGITDLSKMTAGWLLPIVAPIVAAATGGVVASALDPDRALITIIASYVILGTGLVAALAIIVIYLLRVATHKLPPTEHMVSTFLPLGPLGQGGFAAQKLGEQALRVFPLTNTLPDVSVEGRLLAGQIFYTQGFIIAILLWGFGLMWLFFAGLSVTRQKVPFSNGWWAFTFPLGVFATSTLEMGKNLPSITFQVIGTVFGVIVMLFWLMVISILVSKLASGKKYTLFKAPEVHGAHNKRSS